MINNLFKGIDIMRVLDNELRNRTINYDKLLEYGFTKDNNIYLYKKKLVDNQFEMKVVVENNKMSSCLFDLISKDEYILVDIEDSKGEFVGKVRKAYLQELQNIIEKCTSLNIFKSQQAKEVIKYVKEKYNDDLEYLWEKFPENAIWRNKINNKWYGAILVISERKLEISSDKKIEIIDLRYQKDKIEELIDYNKIFPGYHMNKKSWITIKLDGSLELEEIFKLIDNSYNISLKK